jgi:hypothetical protein
MDSARHEYIWNDPKWLLNDSYTLWKAFGTPKDTLGKLLASFWVLLRVFWVGTIHMDSALIHMDSALIHMDSACHKYIWNDPKWLQNDS